MPTKRPGVSALTGIFHQLCPRCRSGKIYPGSILWRFPKMFECCPECGLRYEREPGYFLGAMYISYPIAVVSIVVFTTLLWFLTGWSLERCVVGGVVLFVPLVPPVTYVSRVLWLYVDQGIDPDRS